MRFTTLTASVKRRLTLTGMLKEHIGELLEYILKDSQVALAGFRVPKNVRGSCQIKYSAYMQIC